MYVVPLLPLPTPLPGEQEREDPRTNLFLRPLPSNICLLDIAKRMDTPGALRIKAWFEQESVAADAPSSGRVLEAEANSAAELIPVREPSRSDTMTDGGQERHRPAATPATGATTEDAVSAGDVTANAATATATANASDEQGQLKPSELPDWPKDDWRPPCQGYMVCALCKGRSGPKGRWGPLHLAPPTHVRYPLLVCAPCQEHHGLGPPDTNDAVCWAEGVVKLERRQGYWGGHVAQMVHPSLGDIGH